MNQAGEKSPEIYQPLDFSFFELRELADVLKCEPRTPTGSLMKCPKSKQGKWLTHALKATNNLFEDMNELSSVVIELFGTYEWLTWLDLSCNKLNCISPEIQKLVALKIVYLHGNQIKSVQEIQKLKKLTELNKLTLHGNPISKDKHYFHVALSILPNLISLDFTGISKADRQISQSVKIGPKQRKRRN